MNLGRSMLEPAGMEPISEVLRCPQDSQRHGEVNNHQSQRKQHETCLSLTVKDVKYMHGKY